MSSLISIIIPCGKDSKYLLRCINSIKRQTYTNREILLVSDNKVQATEYHVKTVSTVKNAVEKARGEYVFFCSDTSILTDNVLEELYSNIQEENVDLSCVSTYVLNGADYTEYFSQMSVFGKLFKKNYLCNISINENSTYGVQELLAQYLIKCNQIQESTNAIVYETDKAIFSPEQTKRFEMEIWKQVFELIGTDFSKENSIGKNIEQIVSDFKKEKSVEHKVSYLKNGETQTFLIVSEVVRKKEENVKIVEVPKIVEKTIEKRVEIRAESADIEAFLENMSGDMLVNYVINKYQKGNLGLKTIIKSFFAWMKYKF